MSTGVLFTARKAQSAIATRATTTVSGLDKAARTSRIVSPACLCHEGLNVTSNGSDGEQPPPHAQTRQRVVDLGLREQPLRLGNCIDVPQSRLIARGGLLGGGSCGRDLHRSISGNPASAIQCSHSPIPL